MFPSKDSEQVVAKVLLLLSYGIMNAKTLEQTLFPKPAVE
jgi:hypothetical protein